MATDSILRPGELKEILLKEIQAADLAEIDVREVGTALEVKDGIARIYGLTSAMAGEMLEFTSSETGEKVTGQALNLEEDNIGAVIFGDYLVLREGDEVRRTGRVLEVPVGPALVGRVVDALGRPVDGLGPLHGTKTRKVDIVAPGIIKRQPVKEPLQTGIKAIDSMIPIGRGQRELIIGDRAIGKTAIAVDTIINQKGEGVICVYVAIGQKGSTVASVVEKLKEHGAMDYTIVVLASASEPAPMQYIAPFSGCAMAEYFGVARRRQRPDQGHEAGGGPPAARSRAVPRARGVRPVRLGARPGDAKAARAWGTRRGGAEAAAVPADAGGAADHGHFRGNERLPGRCPGPGDPGLGAGVPRLHGGPASRRRRGDPDPPGAGR